MKAKALAAAFIAATLTACTGSVNYREASGYFFKNNQPCPKDILVITNKAELERHFGYAATMSQRPTEVDFSKEAVLAIVLPETDLSTDIGIKGITSKQGSLTVNYKVNTGAKNSYTIQPMRMIVVDKSTLQNKTVTAKDN